jgi:hypothetical protein
MSVEGVPEGTGRRVDPDTTRTPARQRGCR